MMITAHSGCDSTPENSMAYLHHAIFTGADTIEFDVREDENRYLVLSHDRSYNHAVRLADAFTFLKMYSTQRINCDLKTSGLEAKVYKIASHFEMQDRLIFSGSVSVEKMEKEECLQEVPVFLNFEEYINDIESRAREKSDDLMNGAKEIADICRKHHIDTVNLEQHLVTDPLISFFENEGILLSVWTVDETDTLKWFLTRNLRNITTRIPEQAVQLKREGR